MLVSQQISRRAFVSSASLFVIANGSNFSSVLASQEPRAVRCGLLTDTHYADKPDAGTRFYRDSLAKLRDTTTRFQESAIDFAVELGDFIDAAPSPDVELEYLKTIDEAFSRVTTERHYVLGNHCVDTLTKDEFLAGIQRKESYYSFDRQGIHFVILDACFRTDGKPYGRKNFQWTDTCLPEEELCWLETDLRQADTPTVVFIHQRLDITDNHSVKNHAQVRDILEKSKRVSIVFQGHSHQNALQEIQGIAYCTLRAMVEGRGLENSGYSLLDVFPDGSIELQGFRLQTNRIHKMTKS